MVITQLRKSIVSPQWLQTDSQLRSRTLSLGASIMVPIIHSGQIIPSSRVNCLEITALNMPTVGSKVGEVGELMLTHFVLLPHYAQSRSESAKDL